MELTPTSGTASERVAANVRAELDARGMSQSTLADLLHCSEATLSRRLRGLHPWKVNEVEAAAKVLGLDVNDLTGETAA